MRGKRGKKHSAEPSKPLEQGQTVHNGVVVLHDTGKRKLSTKLPRLSRKQLMLLGVVLLLVMAGGGAVVWRRLHNKPRDEAQYNKSKNELASLSGKANYQAGQNKAAESIPELEAYLANPELTQDLKASAQEQLANAYYNSGKYDQAIQMYVQFSQTQGHETSTSAVGQAVSYRAKGDKQNAIKFYQQAIELGEQELSKLQEGDGAILTYKQQIVGYKLTIKSLQGSP
jgi:tetratricopeptide (TPR) repeat protein